MTREEAQNETDEMLIVEYEPQVPQQGEGNAVPDEFNVNYLKIYYSNFRSLLIPFQILLDLIFPHFVVSL